jgi:spermidine/putrescine transport system substrate-binding protein
MRGSSLVIRFVMMVAWLGIIATFLFMPRIRIFNRAEKSIAILAWPTDVDQRIIADFERETGIRVYVSYFSDYGELFIKLRASKGLGYDLVTPADYIVKPMVKQGLLKPIDKTRCAFWQELNPALLNLAYDPNNQYTIPYFWGMFGVGVNRDAFAGKDIPVSWRLLFDTTLYDGPLGMIDDAREVVAIGAHYLGASPEQCDAALLQRVQALLKEQKKRVVMYTDNRAPYLLLSKTAPVVLTISYEVARVMRLYPQIDFLIPEEGSFLLIDNWAISASSTKDDLVYQFINYMYRYTVLKRLVHEFMFYSPLSELNGSEELPGMRMPTPDDMRRARFIQSCASDAQLTDLWISLKA